MHPDQVSDHNIQFIRLPGRILMADAKQLKKSLHSFLSDKQPLLALDMREVEFIDSSGLAVLVNCLQVSRKKSGNVCLFGMRETVKALFELTRLQSVFPIVNRRQDAVVRLST